MLRKIELQEFEKIYKEYLVKDFKKQELPPLKEFEKRIKNNLQDTYVLEDEGKIVAYCITTKQKNTVLVLYLAVERQVRGKGYGTKLLKEIEKKFQDKKCILLEVASAKKAKNNNVKEICEKRIHFYEKNGYRVIPNLEYEIFQETYQIMINNLQEEKIEKEEVIKRMNEIYQMLLKDNYEKNVKYQIKA